MTIIKQIRSSSIWVTKCNSLNRSIILKCVRCRQLRGKLLKQKMVDYRDRMIVQPPLMYCSIDLFGPFVMKDSKKEAKRYGALYTCQARSYTLRLCTF